jgi:catechol 2,3-dioxygenase-like lactoylglutathione lyase family enzyme
LQPTGATDGDGVIDHLSLGVSDLNRAGVFYDAVLATLGYVRLFTHERAVGYGPLGARDEAFAILAAGEHANSGRPGCHLAFSAPHRQAVDSFHSIALQNGGIDEGVPGLRPKYGPGYYAAFVLDPDGHRLEAVCHEGSVSPTTVPR